MVFDSSKIHPAFFPIINENSNLYFIISFIIISFILIIILNIYLCYYSKNDFNLYKYNSYNGEKKII